MKWSSFGRVALALLSALALGLSMTACGGGTIAYLWTIGQQYSQTTGYKVDDYTGNLTVVPHSPFSTNGAVPVQIVVRPGGRYVYVINQGATSTSTQNSADAGVAVFSVGGEGTLTFQQKYDTRGFTHLWAAFDGTGTYLFVLDKYSASNDGNGAITTFSSDPNTGRLQIVTQTASTPSGGAAPTYLEVGQNPLMMASSGGCLFTVNQQDQSLTPYSVANGQLTTVTTGKITSLSASHITSAVVTSGSPYLVITDSGVPSTTGAPVQGQVFVETVTTNCGISSVQGTPITTDVSLINPSWSVVDNAGKFLYILNQSSTSTATNSSYSTITGYTFQNNELAPISGSPFKTGSGPVCMVEDPTYKYMYVSNRGGSVTGYSFDAVHGTLSDLVRGSTFNINDQQIGCLAISPNVD